MASDKRLGSADACRLGRETLELVCRYGTLGTGQGFGNLFSKLDFVCRRFGLAPALIGAAQRARRSFNHPETLTDEDRRYGCVPLARLISAVFSKAVPPALEALLPKGKRPVLSRPAADGGCIRCSVVRVEGQTVVAKTDSDDAEGLLQISCAAMEQQYILPLLQAGVQLNVFPANPDVLARKASGEGKKEVIVPRLIVLEPDYLLDISAIARCFQDYGHHPLGYLLNQMMPQSTSQAILMGGFAGMALDDIINAEGRYDWRDTLKKSFQERALDYCACRDLNAKEDFKAMAKRQAANIADIVKSLNLRRGEALLEPSFVCEKLGVRGRVDLMTADMRLLVEQKSGKNWSIRAQRPNAHGSYQKEEHYVQLLLYYGVLRQNFLLDPATTAIKLLYSRYPLPGGLLSVAYYRRLFEEAMALRNRIVGLEMKIATDGFGRVIDLLKPETLLQNKAKQGFFNQWVAPRLRCVTDSLQRLSPLEKAYVCRMMTFVFRERLYSKAGTGNGQGNSDADLWSLPVDEKHERGSIYTLLYIIDKAKISSHGGYDLITLGVPKQGEDFLPDFRIGDFVYLYAYNKGEMPDARRSILHKGVMAEMHSDRITVHLIDGQQNPDAIKGEAFAVEHSDRGDGNAVRGLAAFAACPQSRRDLLLGQRPPRADEAVRLSRSYSSDFDPLLQQIMQAKDYYLLSGPPGTGKTSMALQYLTREELARDKHSSVLLMAYTNRAVDEICSMLTAAKIDYIRIGQAYGCDPAYRPKLIQKAAEECPTLAALQARITATRVFVGTTTALQSATSLLALKSFSLAVIDEAGQILEPSIVGLLAAYRHPTDGELQDVQEKRLNIAKFVLIGDHKQLPAVVQQGPEESAVQDRLLLDIGLKDCRESLFERLIRWERAAGRTQFTGTLRKQGRMHPAVAAFPSAFFYAREKLECVPLPHQQEPENGPRVMFVNVVPKGGQPLSDKVNEAEARVVSRCLKEVWTQTGGKFDPARTVGVIVPYRNQIAMIRKEVEKLGVKALGEVSIDTVERYQGSQRDVIVYSFTAHKEYQLDFLSANCFAEDGHVIDRKLNVVMTRARRKLVLIGNASLLSKDPVFAELIGYVQRNGSFETFSEC